MDPELLTVEAAARLLMVGRATAYAWARSGQLPTVRVNGILRVPRSALMRWIDEQVDGQARESARGAADPNASHS